MLKGKHIILGVSSSIACYKSAYLVRALVKQGAEVQVVMTENAAQFITPLTFEQLTRRKCLVDTFDRGFEIKVEHVSLADWADAILVAPADANVIAKFACGIADDMLSTTMLACDCVKILAPAMNTRMYDNPATRHNLETLRSRGFLIIEPEVGDLACGTAGRGRMEEPEKIVQDIDHWIGAEKDLEGVRVLITAGPTREALDPVRYISNHSTGKMGYALARQASMRGADVVLVTGPTSIEPPDFVRVRRIISAEDMYQAVMEEAPQIDVFIMAAAVADYRPAQVAQEKIKKKDGDSTLELERTRDILGTLGQERRPGQILCGFSMETENMLENSRKKLVKKHVDMIVANNLRQSGAGFGTDTNIVTLITAEENRELPILSKDEVADRILDQVKVLRG